MKVKLVALCVIPLVSLGGVTVTRTPSDADHATCVSTASTSSALPITCTQHAVVEGHCDDVPAPEFVPNLEGHPVPGTHEYRFTETVQVKAAYPVCWAVEARSLPAIPPDEIDPDGPWLPEIPEGKDETINSPHGGL